MTLTERLLSELSRLGSASHPLARTLPGIVREHQHCARRVFALAVVVAFLLGFMVCLAWQGVKLEVLAANVEEWRRVAENEYRTHHKVVNLNEAASRAITGQIERRKEGTHP